MDYSLEKAIEQVKQGEESGLNYIYSKTYNYVYLRAKNILKKENDIQQLMQEVYLKLLASAAEIDKEHLYEWLGKNVYSLGCQWYRKKKGREANCLEIEKSELTVRKNSDMVHTVKVLQDSLENLPDLYQATLYAFYYDYMSIHAIAEVMDCTDGIIINRLNYVKKYFVKALEEYQEEKNVKVSFSVEAVCAALREWSVEHCLGITTAQMVYGDICKKANLKPNAIYVEGKEFAGVNNTVVYHKADDFGLLYDEFAKYAPKQRIDTKKMGLAAGVVALVIALILGVILFVNRDADGEKENNNQVQNEEQQKEPENESEEDLENEPESEPEIEPETEPEDSATSTDEYILPESSTRELTRAELEPLTKEQLRLARNEIFARHGMIFGVEDLDTYFKEKSWYQPTIPAAEFYDQVEMSLLEEANIVLIREVEETK